MEKSTQVFVIIKKKRRFSTCKYTPFIIKNNELLEKYNETWEKVKNVLKKGFDSEQVYNKNI